MLTNKTAGIPSFNAISLLIPLLNNNNLERLLNTWKIAVILNTVLKSKNKEAKGTNKIEDPKPETVPTTSETNESMMKRMYLVSNYNWLVKWMKQS